MVISNSCFSFIYLYICNKVNTRLVGSKGEDLAIEYLLAKGYSIIDKNYGVKFGEIDIIAQDITGEIVFVEVKWSKSKGWGIPAYRVTPNKVRTISKVANYFLDTHNLKNTPFRIDVISIIDRDIEHFKNIISL